MPLKMSSQKEYISQLYTQGQFKQMLQYAKQALALALKNQCYAEALTFYKDILEACHNLGNTSLLYDALLEYEALCKVHGNLKDKMHYYRFSGIFHAITDNKEFALKSYKGALHYAHELKDYGIITSCYAMISNVYIDLEEEQQAMFAVKLAQHYSQHLLNRADTTIRMNVSLMYTYAQMAEKEMFLELKDVTMKLIGERPLHFQLARMIFFEGKLLYNLGDIKGSSEAFKKGLDLLDAKDHLVYLCYIYHYILKHQLDTYFPKGYIRTQLQIIECQLNEWRLRSVGDSQPFYYNVGLPYENSHALFDTLSLMGIAQLGETVNRKLEQGESCVCLLFSLHEKTTTVSDIGINCQEQLTYAVFAMIQEHLKSVPHILSNEGNEEGIIILFNEADAEHVVYAIYQKVRKMIDQIGTPTTNLPIHFGLAYSRDSTDPAFEKLYAKASACLYYAHSNNKLYIL